MSERSVTGGDIRAARQHRPTGGQSKSSLIVPLKPVERAVALKVQFATKLIVVLGEGSGRPMKQLKTF
jgi:hypothetical protein